MIISLSITIVDPQYHGSDDDGDDEEEEEGEEGEEQIQKESKVKSEVKAEPGANKNSKDSTELHIYLEDELKLFKSNQLLADVQLLDGLCVVGARWRACSRILFYRKVAEGQAESRSPQGIQEARGRVDEAGTRRRGHDERTGR